MQPKLFFDPTKPLLGENLLVFYIYFQKRNVFITCLNVSFQMRYSISLNALSRCPRKKLRTMNYTVLRNYAKFKIRSAYCDTDNDNKNGF